MTPARTRWRAADALQAVDAPCDPRPLAAFRLAFYATVLAHVWPCLAGWDTWVATAARGRGAWEPSLAGAVGWGVPFATAVVVGCLLGLAGRLMRLAALATGVGLWGLASVNGLYVQSLALAQALAICAVWAALGGGDEVWRLGPPRPTPAPRGRRALPFALASGAAVGLVAAGVEKLSVGWPSGQTLAGLVTLSDLGLVRAWALPLLRPLPELAFAGAEAGTLVVEIVAPPLLFWRRTRSVAWLALSALFAGIYGLLAVPPLFAVAWLGALSLWPATGRHPAPDTPQPR